ncbi:MAG: BadF/BadG/BcrA/BcrD ATPase family protein [Acetanaerobacterium sp.]
MYFIGVDGGGTKTQVGLFDKGGSCLSCLQTGGSNHESLPGAFEEAARVIYTCAKQLLRGYDVAPSAVDGWFMGLAGADNDQQVVCLEQQFKALGLDRIKIFNDGYLPVLAGTPQGVGIAYNAGTGTTTTGIDPLGQKLQIGGLGNYSGDMGSGPWIYEQVWRAAYDFYCVCGPATKLTTALETLVGAPCMEVFQQGRYAATDCSSQLIPSVIHAFFDAWNEGDPVSRDIGCHMAVRGAAMIAGVAKRLDFSEPVDIVLSGSVHMKAASKDYLRFFEKQVQRQCGQELRFTVLNCQPVMGCVKLIHDQVGTER